MKTAVCLVVRNEVRDLAEWIAYHALAGFDAQIIFDNLSTDGTDRLIRRAAARHDVRAHRWTATAATAQIRAYDTALRLYRHEFDWIAFIDSDEFLVVESGETVRHFLARFTGWAGVALPWAIYGSNGHEARPPGLVTESFTRRAPADFFPTRHVKSVVRPIAARRCVNPHRFELAAGNTGVYCTPDGEPFRWADTERGAPLSGIAAAPPRYGTCRVNHYFTRSRAHWREKLRRGYWSDAVIRDADEFSIYDRNDVDDEVAVRLMPRLREAAAELKPVEA